MTYKEQLLDPRWQQKRLNILNRDNWKCIFCGDTDTTLHVHHNSYSGLAWEAPDSELTSVCKHCHILITFFNKEWKSFKVLKIFKVKFGQDFCMHTLLENKTKHYRVFLLHEIVDGDNITECRMVMQDNFKDIINLLTTPCIY